MGEAVNVYFYFSQSVGDLEAILNTPDFNFEDLDDVCSPGLPGLDSPPNIQDLFFNFGLIKEREGYFFAHRSDVSAARAASSLSDQTGLDDLLVWMTRGDLARRMREADVFPLIMNDSDRPPIFREPESR